MILILMGPTGCGKTTIGRLLAQRLAWPFLDGDDFHPAANVAKMHGGIPLDDDDRRPWLAALRREIETHRRVGQSAVLACSALKRAYRELLGVDQQTVKTVYLRGTFDLLQRRLADRQGHFMPPELLRSQLDTLEAPEGGLAVDIDDTPEAIVARIEAALHQNASSAAQGPENHARQRKMNAMHEQNTPQADIGLIGLAVMGENLALNMESRGYRVAVYNRTPEKTRAFMAGRAAGKRFTAAESLEDLVQGLKPPRRVMLMVKAGAPVQGTVDALIPLLDRGDILIDGGNSNYRDTERRVAEVERQGMLYVGTGVSGGEEGALKGPAIMPGGSKSAWDTLRPLFEAIAARAPDGTPCCRWMGPGGSGHFVKMVHNGIEYGDMQIIAEAYHIMRDMLQMSGGAMQAVFEDWNRGDLQSYLIEITAAILAFREADGERLLERILDAAGQKGTGRWTVAAALDLGVPLTLIGESVFARCLSALKAERVAAAGILSAPPGGPTVGDPQGVVGDLEQALLAAKIISYAQGFALLREASATYGWALDYSDIAMVWRSGCIIRSGFLDAIATAFGDAPDLTNLVLAPYFREKLASAQTGWRRVTAAALQRGIPVPALAGALTYYDGLRCANLPANLLQAQRDFFGAHTYERVDQPRGTFFHTEWLAGGED